MRETVQAGSQVVVEIDFSGQTVGPNPITVQPPFDCIRTTESVGPWEPDTYVVRYRYDGQPGTPDLASGTFVVAASPGASPSP
jgi:hypothetical protein